MSPPSKLALFCALLIASVAGATSVAGSRHAVAAVASLAVKPVGAVASSPLSYYCVSGTFSIGSGPLRIDATQSNLQDVLASFPADFPVRIQLCPGTAVAFTSPLLIDASVAISCGDAGRFDDVPACTFDGSSIDTLIRVTNSDAILDLTGLIVKARRRRHAPRVAAPVVPTYFC